MSTAIEPKQARSQATRRKLLDAAVEELVEVGYAKLTTPSVARRAGVSRGAQQHHFPTKATLVREAVQRLIERQLEELTARSASARAGADAVPAVLDALYEMYSGPLFTASIELVLAARGDAELSAIAGPLEREVSRGVSARAAELFGPECAAHPAFDRRLPHCLATIRGIALLKLLGHPHRTVDRQWRFARVELARLLTTPGGDPATVRPRA
ncbi:TetR/AcrR family transcriptional regulator [Patulibacter sp. S7RM1-6]